MLMPRTNALNNFFGESFFDDFMNYPFRGFSSNDFMKTDVKENGSQYEITMDMPGIKKEDVKAELKDGYLTINASSNTSNDEKDDEGRYIRRERYSGSCSRSFYVGEAVTEEDISAKFEDGVLKLSVPKKEQQPEIEKKKYIAIE